MAKGLKDAGSAGADAAKEILKDKPPQAGTDKRPAADKPPGDTTPDGSGGKPPPGPEPSSSSPSSAAGDRGRLPDEKVVCRGGTCTAERFENGSGVTVDGDGKLQGVSVNVGDSLVEASQGIPNGQVGKTTVGEVRAAGGDVVSSPTMRNPNHGTLSGVTPQQAESLFTPTVKNPNALKR